MGVGTQWRGPLSPDLQVEEGEGVAVVERLQLWWLLVVVEVKAQQLLLQA